MIKFILNEMDVSTDLPPGIVLLDFIRYHQNLKGTKIGCREGDCGACTVLVGEQVNDRMRYRSVTSCLMPIGNAHGKHIVSIEGINIKGLNPIQQALADEGATQCGFCTPGFVMSLAGHCLGDHAPTNENAIACIDGNICRCTGYKSIERAAIKINELLTRKDRDEKNLFDSGNKILPGYFAGIRERLSKISREENAGLSSSSGNAKIFVSGGTDLYVQKHDAMTHAELGFLSGHNMLKGISKEGNRCIIGASATVTDLSESQIITEHFPGFSKYAKLVSSTPIRNMATIAGNFANASPIGDFTVFFLALDAGIILSDGSARRKILLKNFYNGYKIIDKRPEEFIENVFFELPGKSTIFNFEKVSKRTHLDIASVNSAMKVMMKGNEISEAVISAGGVSPIPMVLAKTSAFLQGKVVTPNLISEAIQIAGTEISPISDARGSEVYKRLLLSQLLKAHFIELFPQLNSESRLV